MLNRVVIFSMCSSGLRTQIKHFELFTIKASSTPLRVGHASFLLLLSSFHDLLNKELEHSKLPNAFNCSVLQRQGLFLPTHQK